MGHGMLRRVENSTNHSRGHVREHNCAPVRNCHLILKLPNRLIWISEPSSWGGEAPTPAGASTYRPTSTSTSLPPRESTRHFMHKAPPTAKKQLPFFLGTEIAQRLRTTLLLAGEMG